LSLLEGGSVLTIGGTNLGYQEGQVDVTVVDVPTALSSNTPSPSGLKLFFSCSVQTFWYRWKGNRGQRVACGRNKSRLSSRPGLASCTVVDVQYLTISPTSPTLCSSLTGWRWPGTHGDAVGWTGEDRYDCRICVVIRRCCCRLWPEQVVLY